MPENVVRNAREMHTCVNSFLNSADQGLNFWKRGESELFQPETIAKVCRMMRRLANQTDILVETEIRQRRPIIRQDLALDESESDVEAETTKEQLEDGASGGTFIRRYLNSVWKTLSVRLFETHRIDTNANNGTRRAISHY